MGQEHGTITEVLGDGWVRTDASNGGEVESRLLLEELESGIELTVDEMELRFVPLWVDWRDGRFSFSELRPDADRGSGRTPASNTIGFGLKGYQYPTGRKKEASRRGLSLF
ncbi:hypothetical protein QQP08_008607 [Theobroma cacao]|nr:hypothetical protein QQP08_008607 [Theobroma cacao]